MADKKFILLVSGLSGAGKTTALRCLEDMGYQVVDNMPLRMVPALLNDPEAVPNKLALGVDVRNSDISTHYDEALEALKSNEYLETHLLFIDADKQVLMRRFSETRRRHPLAVGRPLQESIGLEEQILSDMKQSADSTVDTSAMSPKDLNRLLYGRFASEEDQKLQVFVMSFGFKYGVPREADVVLDVRFLRNPYWKADLRSKTGLEADVAEYVMADEEFDTAFGNMHGLLKHQLEQFQKADRAYVTIAIGCTGGHHRSVVTSEELTTMLAADGFDVRCHHREIEK